ncbi:NUDIX hydrolase [Flavobacterium sp.]|uniref:NUDIX hydrolase n=1 Tax=Flavobacterium sp. TaxID=239 RepID=UPI0038D19576
MTFNEFFDATSAISEVELPSIASHIKMAPLERVKSLQEPIYSSLTAKKAAVMMLFYPKDSETHLVLIKRNAYPGVHSSQIAFPGGKVDPEDVDFRQTALRETFEEIGISEDKISVVKDFTPLYIPPSDFLVYPFMGVCSTEIEFVLQQEEVAGIIEVPLKTLLDDAIISNKILDTSYAKSLEVPVFEIEEYIVWGATAMMLSELKDVLKMVL